jgi:hypothetical protein
VVVKTLPPTEPDLLLPVETATQSEAEGHETELRWMSPPEASFRSLDAQVEAPPVGSVEV